MDGAEAWALGLAVVLATLAFAMYTWRTVMGAPIGAFSLSVAPTGELGVRRSGKLLASILPPSAPQTTRKACVDPAACTGQPSVSLEECVRGVEATSNAPWVVYRQGDRQGDDCTQCTAAMSAPPDPSDPSFKPVKLVELVNGDLKLTCGSKDKVASLEQLDAAGRTTRITGTDVYVGVSGVVADVGPDGAQEKQGTAARVGCLVDTPPPCTLATVAPTDTLPVLTMTNGATLTSYGDLQVTGGVVGNWVADRVSKFNNTMNACELATVDRAELQPKQLDATYDPSVLAAVTPQCT